jgi:hypothetical protein
VEPSALTLACELARGSSTFVEVATKIAEGLSDCGRFVYNIDPTYCADQTLTVGHLLGVSESSADSPTVNIKVFSLGKIVDRFTDGQGISKNVNCLDCAVIVATLSNMIGCNLQVANLQATDSVDSMSENYVANNRFEVNTIRAIGQESSEVTMAGLRLGEEKESYFTYHAIPWQPATLSDGTDAPFDHPDNIIYDACVQFVTGRNEKGEEKLLSGAGLKLGSPDGTETDSYIALLSKDTANGRARCRPQPVTAVRVHLR